MLEVIEELRSQIDGLDDAILGLLQKRLMIVSEIGEFKRQNQQTISNLQREEEILDRLSAKGILPREQIEPIYRAIFALTRQIQEEKPCNLN